MSSSSKTLDVLVLYTDAASNAAGNIFNVARTAISETETAYRNSGITSRQLNIRRVGTVNVDFQESDDIASDVSRLVSDSQANDLRDTYLADVVVLLTDGDYGNPIGIAAEIDASNSNAYAIVEADHAIVENTFGHEMGHLQGAYHRDSHMWNDGGTTRNTIMHASITGNTIEHFSNPNVYFNGIATGTSNRNVAKKLRSTASTMANFRRPLSVSISGPYLLSAGQQATWTASVHGGRKPYSYRWAKMRYCDDNAPLGIRAIPCNGWGDAGGGRSFTSSFNSSHRLRLTVTDANRTSKTVYKQVLVTEYGPPPDDPGGLSASYKQTAGEALQNSSLTALPETYALASNYPNPFNPSTEIRFTLPEASAVSLIVYDVMGREVERLLDKTLGAGYHEARWDATGLPSGVYLYRIEAGAFAQTRRMTLLK